jgi:hypothetical protein
MSRHWLTSLTALASLTGLAVAQPNTQKPGYLVLRVKLSGDETGGGAAPGLPGGGEDGGTGLGGGAAVGGGGGIPRGGAGGAGGGYPGAGGALGQPGGLPGAGGLGQPGLGGLGGQGGAAANAGLNERSVHVLIPYTRIFSGEKLYSTKTEHAEKNPKYVSINHPFGHSLLYANKVNIQYDFLLVPTEESRLTAAYSKWNADANRKPAVLLAYIGDALKAELLGLAEQWSDSLVKQFEKDKDLPADVAKYIKGYTELRAKWNDAAANNPAADTWKAKFGGEANVHTDSPHYAVVHFTGDSLSGQAGEVVVRAAELLEKNLKCFYLWHLREGYTLPLPDKRQVVVMAKNGPQLSKLREGLDGLAVGSDSFYSPVHNLVVLSPERTDELGRTFNAFASTKLEGFDRNDLLQGKHPALKPQQKADDIALASTYALIRRAIEDESLRSAISREGTRQLLVSLGVLPQHVRLPKWVESGMGSVLQHAKGGGVVELSQDNPGIVVGVQAGHGAANYEHLFNFLRFYPAKKDGQDNKAIDAPAILNNVLTDKYFAGIATGNDPDRPASLSDILPIRPGGNVPGVPGVPGAQPPGGGVAPGGGLTPGTGLTPGGQPPVAPGGPRGGAGPQQPPPGGGTGGRDNDAQGPRGGAGQQPPPGSQLPPPGGALGGGQQPGNPGGDGGTGVFDPTVTNPLLSAAQLEQKAKATAWALTYYATKHGKLPKLYAYLERLNDLPRDLRVDPEVSKKLFCDAFGLLKPNSQEIDTGAFNTFARDWMTFMHQQSPTYQTIPLKKLAAPENNQPGGGPGGLPGGFPGGPGGLPGSPAGPGSGPGGGPGGGTGSPG